MLGGDDPHRSGLPMPHRRTFAAPILGSAHSVAARCAILAALSAKAGSRGTGNPSLKFGT